MRARGRNSLKDGMFSGKQSQNPANSYLAGRQSSGIDKIKHLINRVFLEK